MLNILNIWIIVKHSYSEYSAWLYANVRPIPIDSYVGSVRWCVGDHRVGNKSNERYKTIYTPIIFVLRDLGANVKIGLSQTQVGIT